MGKPIRHYIRKAGRASVRLFNQDCLPGMAGRLAPSSVDVVVTSPPYNLGIRYGEYDDSIPRAAYLDWLDEWALAVGRVLAARGSLFLNIGSKPTDPLVPFQVITRLQEHFTLQNVIHWVKSIAIRKEDVGPYDNLVGDISVGHYQPINSSRYLNDAHEYIFHLTQDGHVPLDRLAIGVPYQDKSNVKRWRSARNDLHCRGNTWFIPYDTIQARDRQRPHPASFPIKLPELCIRLHGIDRTGLVLDPFLGIGSSALAALSLRVNFVGFEIDRAYFREACRRVGGFRITNS